MLLAIDLGVRTAWALYDGQGILKRFESRNFGRKGRLRSGVYGVMASLPEVEVVVAEGPWSLAKLWFSCRRDWETQLVTAEIWRPTLFWPRQRRTAKLAKSEAVKLAAQLIRRDRLPGQVPAGDDAAEAILLGYWAVCQRGWRNQDEELQDDRDFHQW